MGLHLTKHKTASRDIQPAKKAYSDDQLMLKRRWVLSSVYPLKIATQAQPLRRPIGSTSGPPKEPPTETNGRPDAPGDTLPVKAPRRAKSAKAKVKVKSRTWCASDVNNDLRMRTYTKLTCAESTCTLETEQGLAVNRTKSEEDDEDEDETMNDAKNCRGDVVQRTVTFLSYELEPFFVEELCNSKRITEAEEEEEEKEDRTVRMGQRSSVSRTVQSVREILAPIVRDPDSEEYREFCEALRERAHDHYLADLLEVLGSLRRLKGEEEEGEDGEKQSQCLCRQPTADSSSLCRGFDLDIVYVDRETRKTKSFNGVTSLKRRRYRRSRPEPDHVTAVRVGDASDRYVPMLSVRLYAECLCEARARRLQRLVEAYPCVRDLSVVRTRLEDQAKVRLCRAIEQNVGLYALDLNLSCLGDDGAMFLAVALRSNRDLRCLNLSTSDLTERGCRLLARGLACSAALTELNLSFNDVGDAGCEALAGVLAGNRCRLRRLKLRSNGVAWRGAVAIFGSLRKNSRLRLLDVSGNDVTDASLDALRDALVCNRTLTDLSVDGCGITKRGCHVISKALRTNRTLRRVSLSMNAVGDVGVRRLADGLRHNRSLAEISLNMCEISNAGFSHLLDAVRANSRMRTVRLCYNLIDFDPASGNDVIRREVAADVIASSDGRRIRSRERRVFASRHSFPFVGSDVIFARDSEFFDGDAVSVDDVSGSDLRRKLAELLDANPLLKLFLWGNRVDDVSFRLSVTTSSQDSIDYLLTS